MGKLTDGTAKEIRFAIYMQLAAVYLALGKDAEFAALELYPEYNDYEESEVQPNGD